MARLMPGFNIHMNVEGGPGLNLDNMGPALLVDQIHHILPPSFLKPAVKSVKYTRKSVYEILLAIVY